jgi:hypothetical protein
MILFSIERNRRIPCDLKHPERLIPMLPLNGNNLLFVLIDFDLEKSLSICPGTGFQMINPGRKINEKPGTIRKGCQNSFPSLVQISSQSYQIDIPLVYWKTFPIS